MYYLINVDALKSLDAKSLRGEQCYSPVRAFHTFLLHPGPQRQIYQNSFNANAGQTE